MNTLEQFFLAHPWWMRFDGRPVFLGVLAVLVLWMSFKSRINQDSQVPVPPWVQTCWRVWLLLGSVVMAQWAWQVWRTGSPSGGTGVLLWVQLVVSVLGLGFFVAAIGGYFQAVFRLIRERNVEPGARRMEK